jgi:hypothetical protein
LAAIFVNAISDVNLHALCGVERVMIPSLVRSIGVRAGVAGALAFVALAQGVAPAYAAAPRVILVYGGGLPRPVVLDDWNENLDLILAMSLQAPEVSKDSLVRRPSFRVAMFWGHVWDEYMRAGGDPSSLNPDHSQLGRYYPRTGPSDPLFTFDSIPGPGGLVRKLMPRGVEIFTRHSVPSNITSNVPQMRTEPVLLGVATVVVVAALAIAVRRRAARRSERP